VETWLNVVLGLLFLALGLVNTLLMFHLWGYPFDHAANKSSAPRWLMAVHRATGYAFLLIYLFLMAQMLPRIWHYQIELPPRTVMHLTLGLGIGVILIVKISIVRFFKHMESTLVPLLGTLLLICTALLVGLSVPFVFKEQYLNQQAFGSVLSAQNLERLKVLLPRAGFPPEADVAQLATVQGLQAGRQVLLSKCVQCHDLRTVLVKPKPPEQWLQTVNRMADRAVIGKPIEQRERWHVAAYLVGISPDLQQALAAKREQELESQAAIDAVRSLPGAARFDMTAAKQTFETKCMQCHELPDVQARSVEEVKALVARMAGNGLVATPDEFARIIFYLSANRKAAAPAPRVAAAKSPARAESASRY
jgi:mono/diheme cytochrome c family protein